MDSTNDNDKPGSFSFLNDNLISNSIIDYKIVEQQKKIFYFSKFTIDYNEFYEIYNFVQKIKENVFRLMIDHFRNGVQRIILFENPFLCENERIMILYSVCMLNYYSKFTFNIDNKFEDFYNNEFFDLCNNFNIRILNYEQFKILILFFYSTIQSEIKSIGYKNIKNLKTYYNPKIVKKDNKKIINNEKDNNSINQIPARILTFLTCAKERIVDMVFEAQLKNKIENDKEELKLINSTLNKITRESREKLQNNQKEINKNEKYENIKNEKENNLNHSYYSKRVLSELVKCETDSKTLNLINQLGKKIDEIYLDKLLNSKYKMTTLMGNFICYIVEFNSDMIKSFLGYEKIPKDLCLRFIVPAKELYHFILELFTLLTGLSYTNINTILNVGFKNGFPMKYGQFLYNFFKEYIVLLNEEKKNSQNGMLGIFNKFCDKQFENWKKIIDEKGQKLTSFCIV